MLKKSLNYVSLLLTLALFVAAPLASAQTNKADPYDVINKVIDPLDNLTELIDGTDSYDKTFYSEFLTKAYVLHSSIIDAENNIESTSYEPQSKDEIQDIKGSLKKLDVPLGDMQVAARASNQDSLNDAYDSFTDPYNNFFDALDRYDASVGGTNYTNYIIGAVIASALIVPFVLRKRAENWDTRAKKMTVKDNKSLAISPLRFVILNVVTLGMYNMYWSWKLWEFVGNAQSRKYHSTLRSLFFVFTSFRLFKELAVLAKKEGYAKPFNDQAIALSYLIASLLLSGLIRHTSTLLSYSIAVAVDTFISIIILLNVVPVQNFYVRTTKKKLMPLRKDILILCISVVGFLTIFVTISLAYTFEL